MRASLLVAATAVLVGCSAMSNASGHREECELGDFFLPNVPPYTAMGGTVRDSEGFALCLGYTVTFPPLGILLLPFAAVRAADLPFSFVVDLATVSTCLEKGGPPAEVAPLTSAGSLAAGDDRSRGWTEAAVDYGREPPSTNADGH